MLFDYKTLHCSTASTVTVLVKTIVSHQAYLTDILKEKISRYDLMCVHELISEVFLGSEFVLLNTFLNLSV